jgi:hypothetical protein
MRSEPVIRHAPELFVRLWDQGRRVVGLVGKELTHFFCAERVESAVHLFVFPFFFFQFEIE